MRRLAAPGAAFRPGDRVTAGTTHGGLDDDFGVQEAVIRHVRGGDAFSGRVQRPSQSEPRSSDDNAEEESPSVEARVVARWRENAVEVSAVTEDNWAAPFPT